MEQVKEFVYFILRLCVMEYESEKTLKRVHSPPGNHDNGIAVLHVSL